MDIPKHQQVFLRRRKYILYSLTLYVPLGIPENMLEHVSQM